MPSHATRLDLLAIGRSSVDLYGQQVGGRLEEMGSFAKYVGGSPTNTAIGGARLGLNTALLTRVGADHMGRFIHEQLVREGVDVRGVRFDPDRLTALAILGIRDEQTFPLLFYRENCADMAISAADLDAEMAAECRAVLINGTHLSQPGVYQASLTAARLAKSAGNRVVFDVDYRPVLWGLTGRDSGENRFVLDAAVTARLQTALPLCDLVVGTEEEIHILGGGADTMAALREIRRQTTATIVLKLGPGGCVAFADEIPGSVEGGLVVPGFPVEVFNVLGAGDAFMAGLLRGWLREEPLLRCCEWANACGAIVVSRHGCAPAMPTWPELEQFLSVSTRPHRLREDAALEQTHWATTRDRVYDELMVLAFDHRYQFEDMVEEFATDPARIGEFKAMALEAVDQVAGGDPAFGVLIDGRYGSAALAKASDHPYWIGRPIELPRSRPLLFEGPPDVANELLEWPLRQVVKCLVQYHPDDEARLRDEQEAQLLRLFDACRKTRREFLLEVIIPRDMPSDQSTVARALARLYDIGLKPDWWKLEPILEDAAWQSIEAEIQRNDPHCRGVVLLGQSVPEAELITAFAAAAPFKIVKGFAVGRTIFNAAARDWMAGAIGRQAVIDQLAGRFSVLVDAWRSARAAVEQAA